MRLRSIQSAWIGFAGLIAAPLVGDPGKCRGTPAGPIRGLSAAHLLEEGTLVGRGALNINIDGYARAYHPANGQAGALIHLCNAGEVFLPDGSHYFGSTDNATCTGRFMRDFARIGAAGWTDPAVGAIRWFGVLGSGTATIHGRTVRGVVPVEQRDRSGFYVSPTSLADETVADESDQTRYVHPLRVAAAVIPGQAELTSRGIVMGSFGVAYDPATRRSVPFIVGDFGPRVGEATPALARALAGLPASNAVSRRDRFAGQVDAARIVWVFFGAAAGSTSYRRSDEARVMAVAQEAFKHWGGEARLGCVVAGF